MAATFDGKLLGLLGSLIDGSLLLRFCRIYNKIGNNN